MKGYPKGHLSKRDYENLLSMPEYRTQAMLDLSKLAETKDSKLILSVGSEMAPKTEEIDNPLPAWKRAGFKSLVELQTIANTKVVK